MNNLLADIFTQVHNLPKHRTEEVAIFFGLNNHRPTKEEMLLVEDSFQLSTANQLLSLYCLHLQGKECVCTAAQVPARQLRQGAAAGGGGSAGRAVGTVPH